MRGLRNFAIGALIIIGAIAIFDVDEKIKQAYDSIGGGGSPNNQAAKRVKKILASLNPKSHVRRRGKDQRRELRDARPRGPEDLLEETAAQETLTGRPEPV